MPPKTSSSKSVVEEAIPSRAVNRSLQILSIVALHSQEPLKLAEIIKLSALPKSTVHRLLNVLCDAGFLRVDSDSRYGPSPLLLSMGMNFLRQADVRSMALPAMQDLSASTQETSHLGVLQFPWVVYVDKVESPLAVRMHSKVGAMNPLHCTGLGKALLAFSSADLIDRIATGTLTKATKNTITDEKSLRKELAKIREQGFAIDDVENEVGIRCVGAPILGHEGTAIAAISVAGPDTRMTPERTLLLANEVKSVARKISRQLGFTSNPL